jgi:hypothetical protein
MNSRLSRVAYVVVRLQLGDRDYFLLRAHPKWGDWSLVGGHVEEEDAADRAATARREAEEEMPPLVHGRDFVIEPLMREPMMFGPEESRSTGGSTIYETAWFALRFLRDPITCLNKLARDEFVLCDRVRALSADPDVSSLLERLHRELPKGLDAVPLSWPSPIEADRIGIGVWGDSSTKPSPKRAVG